MMTASTTFLTQFLGNGTMLHGCVASSSITLKIWASYFKITDVNQAIYDTIEDSERLQCLIMDISPDADLDKIFRPLENSRTSEMLLGKEKARLRNTPRHASWLRIYAIKLEPGIYIITGGAIKLTRTMQEREHTLVELARMGKGETFLT